MPRLGIVEARSGDVSAGSFESFEPRSPIVTVCISFLFFGWAYLSPTAPLSEIQLIEQGARVVPRVGLAKCQRPSIDRPINVWVGIARLRS